MKRNENQSNILNICNENRQGVQAEESESGKAPTALLPGVEWPRPVWELSENSAGMYSITRNGEPYAIYRSRDAARHVFNAVQDEEAFATWYDSWDEREEGCSFLTFISLGVSYEEFRRVRLALKGGSL